LGSHPVSFVTCVNDREVYSNHILKYLGDYDMIAIFNPPSAAKGLNEGIRKAKNDLVVCLHQDVFLPEGFAERLLTEIEKFPKWIKWGALGLAGCGLQGERLLASISCWSPPHKERDYRQHYHEPIPAQTQDCLCKILERRNGIWFDEGFTGFHMYGEDFCLQAIDRGLGVYVIFNLAFHDSKNINVLGWGEAVGKIIGKWRGKFKKIHTTTGCFFT